MTQPLVAVVFTLSTVWLNSANPNGSSNKTGRSHARGRRFLNVKRMKSFKSLHNDHSGFSLVEILIATVVIGMMVIAFGNIFIAIGSMQRENDNLYIANKAAEGVIEGLRNNHFNTLVADGIPHEYTSEVSNYYLPDPKQATVTITEPTPGLKRIEVSVTWKEGGRDKEVRQSAMLGQIGIAQ